MPTGKPRRLYPHLYNKKRKEIELVSIKFPSSRPNLQALCQMLTDYLARHEDDFMQKWREGLISDVECLTELLNSLTLVHDSLKKREKGETDELFSDVEAPNYSELVNH